MRTWRAGAVLLLLSRACLAQQFEVASIKLADPNDLRKQFQVTPGGRVTLTNLTLKEMIAFAWEVQLFQISGGPAWLSSAHYHLSAKSENRTQWSEVALMIQSLLADRFQLTIHRETRELPIYALVLAKKHRKLGSGLTEAKAGGCRERDPSKPATAPELGRPPSMWCGQMMMTFRHVRASAVPLERLTQALSQVLGRTVTDQTGLTGNFEINLQWTPDENQAMQLLPGTPQLPTDFAPVSIFAALQEQLGLKLESQKGPVEILVIERAEKPSEN
ncbi:MAG TPA: TIGR03435 family protein [Bryobacteraceae bacterium]|nr:TIGR03435 family protein [Bryobacteraceae bacterium]